jgi:hypothetical protein
VFQVFWGLKKRSVLRYFADGLSKLETPKSSTHILEGYGEVRGDQDAIEQLLLGRLQMQQCMVGPVDLGPEGGVNILPGGVQAEVGHHRGLLTGTTCNGLRKDRLGTLFLKTWVTVEDSCVLWITLRKRRPN